MIMLFFLATNRKVKIKVILIHSTNQQWSKTKKSIMNSNILQNIKIL